MVRAALVILLAGLLLSSLALAPAVTAAPPADGIVHTVQPGENLFRIGLHYGVSWSSIMQANGLGSTDIYVGQALVIPAEGLPEPSVTLDRPAVYGVHHGDSLISIARRYGLTVADLAAANNLQPGEWLDEGQRLRIPQAGALPEVEAPAAETELQVEAVAAVAAEPSGGVYKVQPGDTLSAIAQRLNVTTEALAAANGLNTASWVYSGQNLVLPGANAEAGLLPAESVSVAAPASGFSKEIVVDISDQRLYAFQDGVLLYDFIASTGLPGLDTQPGNYSVLNKIPSAYGATWDIWMPNWLGIYWAGSLQNGIHSLPILPGGGRLWEGWLGTPVSYGCVILGIWESQTIYDWAEVGTAVTIRW